MTYLALRWLEDYTADLNGEYFPFDLPSLAFYRRGCKLYDWLVEVIHHPAELLVFHPSAFQQLFDRSQDGMIFQAIPGEERFPHLNFHGTSLIL